MTLILLPRCRSAGFQTSGQIDSHDGYVRFRRRYLQRSWQNAEDLGWTRVKITLLLAADLGMFFQKPAPASNPSVGRKFKHFTNRSAVA